MIEITFVVLRGKNFILLRNIGKKPLSKRPAYSGQYAVNSVG